MPERLYRNDPAATTSFSIILGRLNVICLTPPVEQITSEDPEAQHHSCRYVIETICSRNCSPNQACLGLVPRRRPRGSDRADIRNRPFPLSALCVTIVVRRACSICSGRQIDL